MLNQGNNNLKIKVVILVTSLFFIISCKTHYKETIVYNSKDGLTELESTFLLELKKSEKLNESLFDLNFSIRNIGTNYFTYLELKENGEYYYKIWGEYIADSILEKGIYSINKNRVILKTTNNYNEDKYFKLKKYYLYKVIDSVQENFPFCKFDRKQKHSDINYCISEKKKLYKKIKCVKTRRKIVN